MKIERNQGEITLWIKSSEFKGKKSQIVKRIQQGK